MKRREYVVNVFVIPSNLIKKDGVSRYHANLFFEWISW
jgi:hypothetical protein